MPAELVVRQAGFAPVKGMRHLALEAVRLDEHGAVGDRSHCLVDVGLARVLKTVQHPSLVSVVARTEGNVLSLTLPTGELHAPRGGVVFGDPLTVIGTASLRELARRTGHDALADQATRFRSTVVVETDTPYVEDTWAGRDVLMGEATIRIGGPVPRCAVVDHHPETGAKDVRLLKALVRERPTNRAGEPMLGVYARCTRSGQVTVSR